MNDDQTALDFYTAHRRALVNYAQGILGDPAKAEDVVQEAWLRFHAVVQNRELEDPVSYLYRVVYNLSIDGYRKQAVEKKVLAFGEEAATENATDEGPSPEESAIVQDDLDVLREALEELPERTRIALEMRRYGGYKLREIAEHLEISVTHTHELIAEGIAHCRDCLKKRR